MKNKFEKHNVVYLQIINKYNFNTFPNNNFNQNIKKKRKYSKS